MKQQRRKLLKTMVLGSGGAVVLNQAPVGWTKPVVKALVLPAHAQTTANVVDGAFFGGNSLAVLAVNNTANTAESVAGNQLNGQSWLDWFISSASAGTVAMTYVASLNMGSINALLIRIAYDNTPLSQNSLVEVFIPTAQADLTLIPGACLSGNLQADVYTLLEYVDCEQVFGRVWGKLSTVSPDEITGTLKFEDDSVRSFSVSRGSGSVPCECVPFLNG